jgi:GNAT superfamily N-acetyltransferase
VPAPPPLRRAREDDLEACVELAMHEIAYSSTVGGSVLRPDAEAVKRTALRERFARDEPIWVAERDGRVVGLLECGLTDATPGTWLAGLLPTGRWGYVNCASVLPGRRGHGVGHALVTTALPSLEPPGARGTYLYYNPPNPLSSVFWPRHGYRPLWTLWEVRPASALR